MQRSRRSAVSQLRASDVTKGGQPRRVPSHALRRSTSADWRRNRWRLSRNLEVGRTGQRRARLDQLDRIEQRAAIVALVAARGSRSGSADRCRARSGRAGSGGRAATTPAARCAPRSGRRRRAADRSAASARGSAATRCGRNDRTRGRSGDRRRPGSRAARRNRRGRPAPAAIAPSSAGVPCSSVPQMNSTSSPIWRRKRACTSAGSSEPTRLPRCLTPLM